MSNKIKEKPGKINIQCGSYTRIENLLFNIFLNKKPRIPKMMEAVLTEQQQNVLMLSAITLYWRDAPCRVSMLCCALFHKFARNDAAYVLIYHRFRAQPQLKYICSFFLQNFLLVPRMSVGPTSSASALLKG